jgi:chromate reductase
MAGDTTAPRARLLLVSGSTRGASSNTAALRTAAGLSPDCVGAVLYDRIADLPAFGPDAEEPPAVADWRTQQAGANAVLFCTPEYAGTLPGSFKNALDWTVGGSDLYGKPVAWINVAAPNRGAGATATLRTVLGYVGAVVIEEACIHLPVGRDAIGADGTVQDQGVRDGLVRVLTVIRDHLAATT